MGWAIYLYELGQLYKEKPMRCKKPDGTYTNVTWLVFYPTCPRINVNNLCNQLAGAYVAAVTVCGQRLFR